MTSPSRCCRAAASAGARRPTGAPAFARPSASSSTGGRCNGVDTLSTEVLAPHFEAVESRLHVAPWPLEAINENNRVLWDGLGALGYERGLIRRNVN